MPEGAPATGRRAPRSRPHIGTNALSRRAVAVTGNTEVGATVRTTLEELRDYWLQFELTSVLLVAAIVAALAVIKVSRRAHG